MCFKKSKKAAEPVATKPAMEQVTRASDVTPTGNVTYLTDKSPEREAEVRAAEAEIARRAAEDKASKEESARRMKEIEDMRQAREDRNKKIIAATSGGTYRDIEETETKDTALTTADASKPIGATSVSYQTVVKQTPSEASKEQEAAAAAELARSRQERARQKQSLLRKRLERTAEYGSGKRVLTGEERQLSGMREDARVTQATGKRRGSGRRSLIAGSRGGIGFYSRYS
jgi:hypothetical protein